MSFSYLARVEGGKLAEWSDVVYGLNRSTYLRMKKPTVKGISEYGCPEGRVVVRARDFDSPADVTLFPKGVFRKRVERNHKSLATVLDCCGIKLEKIEQNK